MMSLRPSSRTPRAYALALLLTTAAAGGACTPLAPSVHKSVIREGDQSRSTPATVPSSQSLKSLFPEAEGLLIPTQWVRDDEALDHELASGQELRRVTDEEKKALHGLGPSALLNLELPEDLVAAHREQLRMVIRVQLPKTRFEEFVKQEAEAWAFWLDPSGTRIAVAHELPKSQLASAIVNLYLVSDKQTRE